MKHNVMSMIVVCALGCTRAAPQPAQRAPGPPAAVTAPADGRVPISVDAEGYHPATIRAAAGRQITLVFTRTTDESCGQQLVFPTMGIHKDLPLNQPVEVAFAVPPSGSVAFTCGMNMYRGAIVVQ